MPVESKIHFTRMKSPLTEEQKSSILENLMDDYGNQIIRLAYTYVKNQTVAEDLAQEVFVKCYHHLDDFRGESKLQTWLYRITVNVCKDYLKSWHVRHIFVNHSKNPTEDVYLSTPESIYMSRDDENQLAESVLALPIKYREMVILYYYEDQTIQEISELTGLQENTIKTRLRRAREKLKDLLERSGD